jgi:sugar-specific transcriptional regulator TrmB
MSDKIRAMFPELAETRQRKTRRSAKPMRTVNSPNAKGLETIYEHFFEMVRNIEDELMAFGRSVEKEMK